MQETYSIDYFAGVPRDWVNPHLHWVNPHLSPHLSMGEVRCREHVTQDHTVPGATARLIISPAAGICMSLSPVELDADLLAVVKDRSGCTQPSNMLLFNCSKGKRTYTFFVPLRHIIGVENYCKN